MPIDASIPLQVKVPQFDSAGLANSIQHGRQMQMEQQRLAMQQEQHAQQMQMGNITLQQHQQAAADQGVLRQAQEASGGDLDKTLAAVAGKISPDTYTAFQKHVNETKKQLGELDAQKRAKVEFQVKQVGESAQRVLMLPPEQRDAAWTAEGDRLVDMGVDRAHIPAQMTEEQLQGERLHALGIEKFLSEKRAAAEEEQKGITRPLEVKKLQGEVAESGLKAGAAQRQQDAGDLAAAAKQGPDALAQAMSRLYAQDPKRFQAFRGLTAQSKPEDILAIGTSPHEQITTAATALQHTQTNANEQSRIRLEGARLGLDRQRFNATLGAGLDANGQALPPDQALARAKANPTAMAAVTGDIDPATLRAMLRKTPGLVGVIKTIDPDWSEATMERRFGTLKEFNSTSNSKAGGQAIALNTLVHHADLYLEAADALKNGSFVPGNATYNKIASMFGAAPPGNARLLARFLAGETGKVATGGVPAEGEINGILKNLGENGSPEQMKQAGAKLLQIAGGRATPLIERVKEAKLEKIVHVLGPDAQEILKRRGFDPETMKPAAAGAQRGPAAGTVQDGYRFKGGDPSKPESWEKVK